MIGVIEGEGGKERPDPPPPQQQQQIRYSHIENQNQHHHHVRNINQCRSVSPQVENQPYTPVHAARPPILILILNPQPPHRPAFKHMSSIIQEPEINALERLPHELELRRPKRLDVVLRPRGTNDRVHQLLIASLFLFFRFVSFRLFVGFIFP